MKIVVIGGTGLIGSNVVNRLRRDGHETVAASPGTGVNTITGEGWRRRWMARRWWSTWPTRLPSRTRPSWHFSKHRAARCWLPRPPRA